jgi:TPR repeat protein
MKREVALAGLVALAGVMVLAGSAVMAQAPPGAPDAAAECDRLAASPNDPQATAPGIAADLLDHARAIPACEAAVARHPEMPRLVFQLGRTYAAAGRESDAVRLQRQAAENGYTAAMGDLGYLLNEGRGVAMDKVEAVRWFRRAAEKGAVAAMDDLATAYLDGAGIGASASEALRWYRQAADKGYGPSMHSVGLLYQFGQGVEKDDAEAERWFRRALEWYREEADKGAAFAMAGVGMFHERGDAVSRDDAEAVHWLRRAAERRSAAGMFRLAYMYTDGRGGLPRDGSEAKRWLAKAAEKGYAPAMTSLGRLYALDSPGDATEAVRWLRRASEKGDAFGSFTLSFFYSAGVHGAGGVGVPKDDEEAARLLLRAVRQAGSADLVRALKQNGVLLTSPESCEALQRRLRDAGVHTAPIGKDCGPEVLRAIDRFRERDPGPQ